MREKSKEVLDNGLVECFEKENTINSQKLEEEERQDLFDKYFSRLSDSNRELWNLFFEGKSTKEISEITGYSEGYVRKKKYKSKDCLQKMIKKDPIYQELVSL